MWAIVIAYMLGFHNVYHEQDDMANNMEVHDYHVGEGDTAV